MTAVTTNKTARAMICLFVFGLAAASELSTMRKKSDEKSDISVPQSPLPLLGRSGPFGSSGLGADDIGKLTQSLESSQQDPMAEITGTLSFFVVSDPKSFLQGIRDPNRYLNIDLSGDEWGALFYDVLGCPKASIEPFSSGDDVGEWRNRYRRKFQANVTSYPMLSRIWDLYEYVSYRPDEITQLREESVSLRSGISDEKAIAALTKVIVACDAASKANSGLLLVPD